MSKLVTALNGLHKLAVSGIVVFTIYAAAETYSTFNASIENAKIRMEADLKKKEQEGKSEKSS